MKWVRVGGWAGLIVVDFKMFWSFLALSAVKRLELHFFLHERRFINKFLAGKKRSSPLLLLFECGDGLVSGLRPTQVSPFPLGWKRFCCIDELIQHPLFVSWVVSIVFCIDSLSAVVFLSSPAAVDLTEEWL